MRSSPDIIHELTKMIEMTRNSLDSVKDWPQHQRQVGRLHGLEEIRRFAVDEPPKEEKNARTS